MGAVYLKKRKTIAVRSNTWYDVFIVCDNAGHILAAIHLFRRLCCFVSFHGMSCSSLSCVFVRAWMYV